MFAADHGDHFQQQGQGEQRGEHEDPHFVTVFGGLAGLFLGPLFLAGRRGGESGAGHGGDQSILVNQAGLVMDPRLFGGQVDLGLDPGQLVEHSLQAAGAGGAGHA